MRPTAQRLKIFVKFLFVTCTWWQQKFEVQWGPRIYITIHGQYGKCTNTHLKNKRSILKKIVPYFLNIIIETCGSKALNHALQLFNLYTQTNVFQNFCIKFKFHTSYLNKTTHCSNQAYHDRKFYSHKTDVCFPTSKLLLKMQQIHKQKRFTLKDALQYAGDRLNTKPLRYTHLQIWSWLPALKVLPTLKANWSLYTVSNSAPIFSLTWAFETPNKWTPTPQEDPKGGLFMALTNSTCHLCPISIPFGPSPYQFHPP